MAKYKFNTEEKAASYFEKKHGGDHHDPEDAISAGERYAEGASVRPWKQRPNRGIHSKLKKAMSEKMKGYYKGKLSKMK